MAARLGYAVLIPLTKGVLERRPRSDPWHHLYRLRRDVAEWCKANIALYLHVRRGDEHFLEVWNDAAAVAFRLRWGEEIDAVPPPSPPRIVQPTWGSPVPYYYSDEQRRAVSHLMSGPSVSSVPPPHVDAGRLKAFDPDSYELTWRGYLHA